MRSRLIFLAPLGFLLLVFGFLSRAYALGNNIYISQNAAGAQNGADCADSYGVSFFNTSSNWASTSTTGKISPGATVYLCGTFTASAGASSYLQFQGSGAIGNPITLFFEPSSTLTAAYWSGAAINTNGQSWLVINGNNTGVIQATANGTGLANQQDNGIGVGSGAGCSNCTVENLTISNLYVHTCTGSLSSCTDEGGQDTYGIYFIGGSNTIISGNTIHDAKWCAFYGYGSNSSGIQISNNTLYDCDHGVVFGDAGAGDTGTGSIFGNSISSMSNWDDAADDNHHDGIHTWANNTGSSYTLQIYDNYLHGNGGSNFNSWIGIEANGSGTTIFNNLISMQSNCVGGVGLLGLFSGGGPDGNGVGIYNNTIQGNGTSDSCTGVGIQEQTGGTKIKNNIIQNTNTFIYIPTTGEIAASGINNNIWYNSSNNFWCPGNIDVNFSGWQSGCGYDANGLNNNPNLNASFIPNSGSPVIGAAINLTSLGIAPLDTDKAGNSRPTSAAWDIGAYQYLAMTPSSFSVMVTGGVTTIGSVLFL